MADGLEYVQGFRILGVTCVGCGQLIQPKAPATVSDLSEAHGVAMQYHAATQLVCPRREFIIDYSHVLLDSRVVKRVEKAKTNGDNGAG